MRGFQLLVVLCFFAYGCTEHMVPTPYVMYGDQGRAVFDQVPEALRTTDVKVFYVTDRAAERTSERGVEYGYGRAMGFAYGIATVRLGADVTWDELVADSTSAARIHEYVPAVVRIEELGTIPSLQSLMEARDRRFYRRPDALEILNKAVQGMLQAMQPLVDQTDRKEAVLFVHGFNNSFDDAVVRIAQAWHFGGRKGVPIAYTWPAGAGVFEYARDRESGEFTVVHLKMVLLALASSPQIQGIHVVSHSRGTDVATTAIRELNSELRGAVGGSAVTHLLNLTNPVPLTDQTTASTLKLKTLVLAAPDIDVDVFRQRFFGEGLANCAERVVIYFSPTDKALDWAGWLFSSQQRLGKMELKDFTPDMRDLLGRVDQPELIQCEVSGTSSHSYILQHPGALSDLILLLREGRPPGAANGRPLNEPFKGVWELNNDYLKPKAPAQ